MDEKRKIGIFFKFISNYDLQRIGSSKMGEGGRIKHINLKPGNNLLENMEEIMYEINKKIIRKQANSQILSCLNDSSFINKIILKI